MFDKLLALCGKQDQPQTIDDTYDFIWGVKSADDLSKGNEANLLTMNDFDILYNKKNKTYSMSIETIYELRGGKAGEKTYIKNLFNKLTEWMESKKYDTTQEVTLYEIFTQGKNINTEFQTLEELYAVYKCLVFGFCEG